MGSTAGEVTQSSLKACRTVRLIDWLYFVLLWPSGNVISNIGGLSIRKQRDTLAEFDIQAADIINYDTVRACRYNGYTYIRYT